MWSKTIVLLRPCCFPQSRYKNFSQCLRISLFLFYFFVTLSRIQLIILRHNIKHLMLLKTSSGNLVVERTYDFNV